MAKYSMKKAGKEVGPAEVYAEPHTMSGKKITTAESSVVKKGNVGTTHDGMGGQIKVFKLLEYRPPKKASGSPSGSKSNAKKGAAADPNQAALDEIARLTKQYQSL
jgi:hypothetical protein